MKKGLLGGIGLAVVIIAGLICVAKCSVRVPAGLHCGRVQNERRNL